MSYLSFFCTQLFSKNDSKLLEKLGSALLSCACTLVANTALIGHIFEHNNE